MTATKEPKSKFTASVRKKLVTLVDERAAKLNVTRSDVMEQAMELWLRTQAENEEDLYFEKAATEMNADAKAWNAVTSKSIHESWQE